MIRRKSLSSDQFDRSKDELNGRIDTLRKSVQESKNEFNRFNERFLELSTRINEKCDDRRADKMEDKIFQCAERSIVEKLE